MIRFFALLLVSGNAVANEIIFYKGINQEFGMAFSEEQKIALPILTQVTKANTEKASSSRSISFTNFNEGDKWYRLYENFFISGVDVKSKSYLGGMEIDAFNDPELEPEIISLYQERYNVESHSRTIENTKQFPSGCLISSPLRYGDLTGDTDPELAIYAQNQYGAVNITFFSTESNKIIFQYRAISDDSKENLRKELDEGEFPSDTSPLANHPTDGQFLSVIAEENTPKMVGVGNAIIQFAKIYLEDVDSDEKPDLIQWRKLYQTRENQDPINGFKKVRDTFIHFKLIDGEYKKQSTEQSVVRGWLDAKNLTWQKGYPSKSECPGQEGQLIPEMHDPLLNDPDVLK